MKNRRSLKSNLARPQPTPKMLSLRREASSRELTKFKCTSLELIAPRVRPNSFASRARPKPSFQSEASLSSWSDIQGSPAWGAEGSRTRATAGLDFNRSSCSTATSRACHSPNGSTTHAPSGVWNSPWSPSVENRNGLPFTDHSTAFRKHTSIFRPQCGDMSINFLILPIHREQTIRRSSFVLI